MICVAVIGAQSDFQLMSDLDLDVDFDDMEFDAELLSGHKGYGHGGGHGGGYGHKGYGGSKRFK